MIQQQREDHAETAAKTDALLEHIARYRLTVFPAVQRLPAFAAAAPGRVKEALKDARK